MAPQLRRGRRLGIDYGDVRVGIAISDIEAILVSPLITLKNDADLLTNIEQIILENEPIYIALGSPVHLSGKSGSKSLVVQEFASKLKNLLATDIFLIDERLTTMSAQNQLREVGKSSRDGKAIIDQIAAINILNQALRLEASEAGLGSPL
jgi:putative Holliday junction resolvase